MVRTQSDLEQEVSDLIFMGVDSGQIMPANWIVTAIMEKHTGIEGRDRDFYVLCANAHVRATVRRCLRDHPQNEDRPFDDDQLTLPGFERLQKAYLIDRDGDQQIVPLEQMTNADIKDKIAEYRMIAAGCLKHADELERWRREHFGD